MKSAIHPKQCRQCKYFTQKEEGFILIDYCSLHEKKVFSFDKSCEEADNKFFISKEDRERYRDNGSCDFYDIPCDWDEWKPCPVCGAKPLVWSFDNGESTMCRCENKVIKAESIVSVYRRTGLTAEYDHDGLKNNWNHYAETLEIIPLEEGRW